MPTAGEWAIGMSSDPCQRTYDLSFKHIGCTAVSAEVAEVVSDELIMRSHAATLDFADPKQIASIYARPRRVDFLGDH